MNNLDLEVMYLEYSKTEQIEIELSTVQILSWFCC